MLVYKGVCFTKVPLRLPPGLHFPSRCFNISMVIPRELPQTSYPDEVNRLILHLTSVEPRNIGESSADRISDQRALEEPVAGFDPVTSARDI